MRIMWSFHLVSIALAWPEFIVWSLRYFLNKGAGLSPKGLAVRLAWIEGDKAKTESDKVKKAAERKELQPYFREEWLVSPYN